MYSYLDVLAVMLAYKKLTMIVLAVETIVRLASIKRQHPVHADHVATSINWLIDAQTRL